MTTPYTPPGSFPAYICNPYNALVIWDEPTNSWIAKTTADGLNNVAFSNKAVFGGDGKLYIPTYQGLCIWDGSSFSYKSTLDGLIDNYILCVAAGPNNKIYIGTYYGLSVWDGTSFTNYSGYPTLLSNYISDMVVDNDGYVYMATGSCWVVKFNSNNPSSVLLGNSCFNTYQPVNKLTMTGDGKLFGLSNYGPIYQYDVNAIQTNATEYIPPVYGGIDYGNCITSSGQEIFMAGGNYAGTAYFLRFNYMTNTWAICNSNSFGYGSGMAADENGFVYLSQDDKILRWDGVSIAVYQNVLLQGSSANGIAFTVKPLAVPTNVKLVNGVVVGDVTVDPRTVRVLYNGLALPQGSVLRNTTTGLKYMKKATGVSSYNEVRQTPDPAWGWTTGYEAWYQLQNF